MSILSRTLGSFLVVGMVCGSAEAVTAGAFVGSVNVGQQSAPTVLTITMTGSGVAAAPAVLTQGVAGLDFGAAAGGTCAAGTTYNVGDQCTVAVTFAPRFPGLRNGAVVMQAADGSLLARRMLSGMAWGSLATLVPGRIDTVAGDGAWVYTGDGGPATQSPIFLPTGLAMDAAGNLFLSDSNNQRIRRVDALSGAISTIAGNGTPGYSGDGGLATQAEISAPAGLALDGAGDLYFVDSGNHAIRLVDAVSGVVTTVAGTPGSEGYSGDGGLATAARLTLPEGLALDAAQNLYIGDTGNNVVRMVTSSTGLIRTLAGTGTQGYNGDNLVADTAQLNAPWGVAVAADGSIYIADSGNNRVRRVAQSGSGGGSSPTGPASQVITTVAGTGTENFGGDGGPGTAARLNTPAALAFDPAGDLYIADSGNNRVRKLSAATGIIGTVTGNYSEEFSGDGGPANLASLYGTYALLLDQAGNLLVADLFHNRVRRISSTTVSLVYPTMRVGKISPPQLVTIENDGNGSLTPTQPVLNNAALDAIPTTCAAASAVAVDASCVLGVEFAPTTTGVAVMGSVSAGSDAGNSPIVVDLSGTVLSVDPTALGLVSSANPSLLGAAVTFTATVTGSGSGWTGAVKFFDGTTQICNVNLVPGGTAACRISTLTLGSHSITASYAGDATDAASTSTALTQVVKQAPTLVLGVTPNPATVTGNVTLTVTASAATSTPTGTIVFYDGTTAIGSGTLNGSGVATFATTQLAPGTHAISGQYAGDTADAAGQSNTVSEVIDQAATVTMLATSNVTVTVGTAVTLTATVSCTGGPVPTGTVQFSAGNAVLGSATVGSNGVAAIVLSSLAPGVQNVVATYSGDTDDAGSVSPALVETVQQIGTVTALVADANPVNALVALHVTATVTMAAGMVADGAITGQVTFSEGATVLGRVAVNASGVATLTLSSLAVGQHGIVASYAGNANYAGSASAGLSETVSLNATSTVLAPLAGLLAGTPVVMTATVAGSNGVATGTVTFMDGSTRVGAGTLNSQGVATLTVASMTVGSHPIVATYGGDANFSGSSSATVTEVVSLGTTGLTLQGPTAAVTAGTAFSVTGLLTSNGVAPTGALTLRDGGVAIATQNASGTYGFAALMLSVGSHTLTTTYAGDGNNGAATSNSLVVVVVQASTATALIAGANPAILAQSITFTASVSSVGANITGTVNFLDGGVAIGSGTVGAGGLATFTTSSLSLGSHLLTAVYSGDTNHSGSGSAIVTESIVQPVTVTVGSSANPSISGISLTFSAKVAVPSGVVPTGTVTFLDGGTAIGAGTLDSAGNVSFSTSALAVGTHTIGVSYGGDVRYGMGTAQMTQTIQSAGTQIGLTASANPAIYGASLSFTATIASNGGVATGTVTFTDGGRTIGSGTLDASGVARMALSTLAPGTHSVVANYAGDGRASASVSTPLAITVEELTAVGLTASVNPVQTLSPVTLTAVVTNSGVAVPTGTVSFTDGAVSLGTSPLDASGHATLTLPQLSAGSHSIVASYAGDGDDFASISAGLNESVTLRPTATALSATQTDANNPLQVTLISVVRSSGTVVPTGTVTFSTSAGLIGTSAVNSTGVASMTIVLSSMTESIVASYSGDASYAASASIATTISGGPATQFTLTLSAPDMTVASKQHGVLEITATSIQGFTDTLQFGCLGLPFAATCTFSGTTGKLAANGSMVTELTVDTGDPLGGGAQASNAHGNGLMMCFLPGGLLAGFALYRLRRRSGWKAGLGLLMAIVAVAATMGMTGCAGLQQSGTPAGTYTFKVTASGQGTGATQFQVMTLTVTQ